MKDVQEQEHEVKYNLDPILLFTVVQGKSEHGVFYVPQRGVGMLGFAFDGSTVSVAKRISNMQNVSIIPGEISIPEIDTDTIDKIVQAIDTWMRSWNGEELEVVKKDKKDKSKNKDEDEDEDE